MVTQRSRWAFGLLVDQTLFRAFCKEPKERVFFAIREIRSQIEIGENERSLIEIFEWG